MNNNHSFSKLSNLASDSFSVFAISPEKKFLIYLETFKSFEQAEKYIKFIIEKTGVSEIHILKSGHLLELNNNNKNIKSVLVDTKNKLLEFDNKEFEMENNEYKKRENLRKEIEMEIENEYDISKIEFYQRNMIKTLNTYEKIISLKSQLENQNKDFEKSKSETLKCSIQNPNFKNEWLQNLEFKLKNRGESMYFNELKNKYEKLKNIIFHI
jgi:hypothetical protein